MNDDGKCSVVRKDDSQELISACIRFSSINSHLFTQTQLRA